MHPLKLTWHQLLHDPAAPGEIFLYLVDPVALASSHLRGQSVFDEESPRDSLSVCVTLTSTDILQQAELLQVLAEVDSCGRPQMFLGVTDF